MKLIRVAAAALNQTPLYWDGNAANIRRAIALARERGARLLCLPELCITGYGCEDAFYSHAVLAMAERVLAELLPETDGMVVSFGLPIMHHGARYNAAPLAVDGRIVGVAVKQRLAGEGLHYEPRWFKPWPSGVSVAAHIAGQDCPQGDLIFDIGGIRVGFEICEDAWVADRPGEEHARQAADLILNPSASHCAFGKHQTRSHLVAESSRAFGVTYVYSNLVGNEAGRIIYDGQTLIATHGDLVARGPRLNFQPVTLAEAVVDVDATRMRRSQSVSFIPSHDVLNAERQVSVDFQWPACKPQPMQSRESAWEHSKFLQEEEFARAIALGLYDYLRKSRSTGFVVSLSGGADSAAVACLVALMVKFGVADLGADRFLKNLGRATTSEDLASAPHAIVNSLLTTVYQATRNSSQITRQAASAIADAVGALHLELDVDDVCESYTKKIEAALGRGLSWETDDVTLQNIQARVRAPSVWMLANVQNALLLATSNRSEAAVGYATMDGDTCGGHSPIAGIDKAFLRRWLRWLETTGPDGVGPIPELSAVNALQPTAELRPTGEGQTDETDLMPYDVLDAIEHQAIGEKRSPAEVLAVMAVEFPRYDHQQLASWIRRFFQLWGRNQWKRERYAPSFHVDDKNLDPKTWCRFPILSGGFRRELSELESADG
ncbi:MAG TPA: NAD(+) synthase [Lacipirellula sp.]